MISSSIQRISAVLVCNLFIALCFAQTAPTVFWVTFSDKDATPFSVSQPEAFLSERAIQRRVIQGIPVNEQDLPVDPAYINTVLAQGDITLVNQSKWFNSITIRTTDPNVLDAVLALPFVQTIEPTRMLIGSPVQEKFNLHGIPDPGGARGGDEADYGPSFNQISIMNGQVLHAMDAKGQGMLIGVLDSGFDNADNLLAFADLRAREGILLTRDLVNHDGDVYGDHWHGRSVLSCMAGYLPGQLKGTAPEADYVLIRTEDVDTEYRVEEDNWISGVELADSLGCDVLNTSLGYTTFDDTLTNHIYSELNGTTLRISIAAGMAAQKGMIPVISAGNSGSSDWYYLSAPSDAIDILTVGAVDNSGNAANFSSRGPSADGRVKPDVMAVGAGAIGLRYEGDSIAPINGTSFAAPILAGMVACLWQLHPERTSQAVMAAVRASASLYTMPNDSMGFGIPNFVYAHDLLTMSTGLNEQVAAQLTAFPIPFSDHLSIGNPDLAAGVRDIALFDAIGRNVFASRSLSSSPVIQITAAELASLKEGVYILRITVNGKTTSRTVVKGK